MEETTSDHMQPDGLSSGRKGKKGFGWLLAALLVLGLVISFIMFYHSDTSEQAHSQLATTPGQITVGAKGFSPTSIRVHKGQPVTWNNQDTEKHAIMIDDPSLGLDEAETLDNGDAFVYTFAKTGTYRYHDPLHDKAAFRGTVIVEE